MSNQDTNETPRILIVEDTFSLATVYIERLSSAGYSCDHVETAADAVNRLANRSYGLVLLDLGLPDSNGMSILAHIKKKGIETSIVIITANGSINVAIDAMRLGAYDFLVKPFSKERLLSTAENAISSIELRQSGEQIRSDLDRNTYFGFIGSSAPMQNVYKTIDNVARSQATVFITGESGTGKEVCAEAIHRRSQRQSKPFVPLNCGAIPKDLVESEIFGHLKGAFTGAIADRKGSAGQADGGTLFLDEICEMDLALQTKLLRFLQTGTIQRVGSSKLEEVDVRVICATNRNPAEEVRSGRFREDLYYRLFVVPIELPPLRLRGHDISEIAQHFLETYAAEENKTLKSFSPEAIQAMEKHSWPGNVRELQNLLRNIVVMNQGEVVDISMLSASLSPSIFPPRPPVDSGAETVATDVTGISSHDNATIPGFTPGRADDPLSVSVIGKSLVKLEREAIEKVISYCGGSIPKAARELDVSPSTIYRKREAWEKLDSVVPTPIASEECA